MAKKPAATSFRYRCPDCGSIKEFATKPALPPTCCGNTMQPM